MQNLLLSVYCCGLMLFCCLQSGVHGLRLRRQRWRGGLFRVASLATKAALADDTGLYGGYEIDVHKQHPRTKETAVRHCDKYKSYAERHVIARHTKQAFSAAQGFVEDFHSSRQNKQQLVILDSGCGQGLSSLTLARANPDVVVIGIDRSFHRLSRNVIGRSKGFDAESGQNVAGEEDGEESFVGDDDDDDEDEDDGIEEGNDNLSSTSPLASSSSSPLTSLSFASSSPFAESFPTRCPNLLLVRAEISDFWSLACLESTWVIEQHHILYPNPYPKGKHLRRRWHGHPCFPVLLALGGTITVRSNWKIYCDEFQSSVEAVIPRYECFPAVHSLSTGVYTSTKAMTHFERKYMRAGIQLHQSVCALGQTSKEHRIEVLSALSLSS